MSWHKDLAARLSRHSDALAVIRAGHGAKRRTVRRARARSRADIEAILASLGPEFDDPDPDRFGGANLEPSSMSRALEFYDGPEDRLEVVELVEIRDQD